MKNIILLFLGLTLMSCGSFQLSTINHSPIVTQEGIVVEVVDNEYSLQRKFDTDSKFRWNFAKYAMDQDLRWYYSFYNRNRLFRYNYNLTPWDLYVNKYDFWFDWDFNYNFRSYRFWNPYRFNSWGWNSYDPYYSNFHIWNRPSMAHMNRYRQSIQVDIKDREIKNRVRTRAIANNNSNVRVYNRPELSENKLKRSVDILKGRNKDIIIRNYNNSNQLNNDKTIKLNPRSYGRPESSGNGGRSWSREVVPSQPVKSRFIAPSQPRQVYRGSRSSSVPKANTGNNSSRQGSSRVNIK